MLMDNAAKKFVIQEHTTPNGVHWDLMLEMEDALWTWRLNTPPADIKSESVSAERIFDHPLRFLTYEGPVQNGTGQVTIADKGTYALIEQIDTALLIDIQGKLLSGRLKLSQMDHGSQWNLCTKKE